MKKLCVVLLMAALALPLLGCNPTVHGGGQVSLLGGNMEVPAGDVWETVELGPGTATFAVTAICSDNKDAVMSSIEWNDQANDFRFHARLKWTPISELTGDTYHTCEELATATDINMPAIEGAVTGGYVNEQGQEIGDVTLVIGQPGQTVYDPFTGKTYDCAGSEFVFITGSGSALPHYTAYGCLEHGSIVFQ